MGRVKLYTMIVRTWNGERVRRTLWRDTDTGRTYYVMKGKKVSCPVDPQHGLPWYKRKEWKRR